MKRTFEKREVTVNPKTGERKVEKVLVLHPNKNGR